MATTTTTKRKAAPAPLTVTIKDGRLIVDAPLTAPVLSASGKSFVIASTHGNLTTETMFEGRPIVIGLNAYYRHE